MEDELYSTWKEVLQDCFILSFHAIASSLKKNRSKFVCDGGCVWDVSLIHFSLLKGVNLQIEKTLSDTQCH